jgi:hypothetical protein
MQQQQQQQLQPCWLVDRVFVLWKCCTVDIQLVFVVQGSEYSNGTPVGST